MLTRNRIIWNEGLFIKPQHFQQQQRHNDYLLHSFFSAMSEHFYGVTELKINEEHLSFGQVTLISASGIMPDGTLFNLPYEDILPQPLKVAGNSLIGQVVYLAVPLMSDHIQEVNLSSESSTSKTRYQESIETVRDLYSASADIASLKVAKVNLRLMLESDDRSTFASIPVARIADKRPDGSLLLDNNLPDYQYCFATQKLSFRGHRSRD